MKTWKTAGHNADALNALLLNWREPVQLVIFCRTDAELEAAQAVLHESTFLPGGKPLEEETPIPHWRKSFEIASIPGVLVVAKEVVTTTGAGLTRFNAVTATKLLVFPSSSSSDIDEQLILCAADTGTEIWSFQSG